MENHRTSETYSHAFETYLAHTDEKSVLFEALASRLRTLTAKSLLDIGAGNGDLALPLSHTVERYLAIEQKPDFVERLRSIGLEVLPAAFPSSIEEHFDVVLASHSLPSYHNGLEGWLPFLNAARALVNPNGHLFILTFEEEESEWTALLAAADLERGNQEESRLLPLMGFLGQWGEVRNQVIHTHVRTKTIDDLVRALAFVWSDGRADRLQTFMANEEVRRHVEALYKSEEGYSFPFKHYLLDTTVVS